MKSPGADLVFRWFLVDFSVEVVVIKQKTITRESTNANLRSKWFLVNFPGEVDLNRQE